MDGCAGVFVFNNSKQFCISSFGLNVEEKLNSFILDICVDFGTFYSCNGISIVSKLLSVRSEMSGGGKKYVKLRNFIYFEIKLHFNVKANFNSR